LGQLLDGLDEAQPMDLLDEAHEVPATLAAVAMVELLVVVDAERRRALRVERAQTDVVRPRLAKHDVLPDALDEAHRLLDLLEELPRNPALHCHANPGEAL